MVVPLLFFFFFADPPENIEARVSVLPVLEGNHVVLVCTVDGNPTPTWRGLLQMAPLCRTGQVTATSLFQACHVTTVVSIGAMPPMAWNHPNQRWLSFTSCVSILFMCSVFSASCCSDRKTCFIGEYSSSSGPHFCMYLIIMIISWGATSWGRRQWCFLSFFLVPAKILHFQNVTIEEGKNALLECKVEGNPTPLVTWIGQYGAVLQNRTSKTSLEVPNVSRDKKGNYKCTASNGLGNQTKEVYLDVQCKWPVFTFLYGSIHKLTWFSRRAIAPITCSISFSCKTEKTNKHNAWKGQKPNKLGFKLVVRISQKGPVKSVARFPRKDSLAEKIRFAVILLVTKADHKKW